MLGKFARNVVVVVRGLSPSCSRAAGGGIKIPSGKIGSIQVGGGGARLDGAGLGAKESEA